MAKSESHLPILYNFFNRQKPLWARRGKEEGALLKVRGKEDITLCQDLTTAGILEVKGSPSKGFCFVFAKHYQG